MMRINREVKVFVLIGGAFLLAFALAYATTTLPSARDGRIASERVGGSSIERVSLINNDFRAELTTDGSEIVSGQPTSLMFNIKDSKGALVRDLSVVHEKPIHLIVVSTIWRSSITCTPRHSLMGPIA